MSCKPIIFRPESMEAILSGRKTQTRRLVKNLDYIQDWDPKDPSYGPFYEDEHGINHETVERCPYGRPGDQLWIRESWRPVENEDMVDGIEFKDGFFQEIENSMEAADKWVAVYDRTDRWRSPLFMPRWASRLTVDVTGIRVDRVQNISEEDAKAEGVEASETVELQGGLPCYTLPYQKVWTSLHGIDNPAAWDSNPWVWVVEFSIP